MPGSEVARYAPRWVLIGDGESPHLLKWARGLQAAGIADLHAISTRGFLPGFDAVLPPSNRWALGRTVAAAGGNLHLLTALPSMARTLARLDADVIHAHYLTSHGTLAWLARRLKGLRAELVASAWGSDILVTPERSAAVRAVTRRVLRAAVLTTSDSAHMAECMRRLGAREVMTFPFGLDALPQPPTTPKDPDLVYANRGLEPLYRPELVLRWFAAFAQVRPRAQMVVANDGSLRAALHAEAERLGLAQRVRFVGRIDAQAQAAWYDRASWFLSLPASDSVAVSVLEAMAHGCIPVLSDLPANRELIEAGEGGWIVGDGDLPCAASIDRWTARADEVARINRAWVARHGLFAPAVARFLDRMRHLQSTAA
jgi:L-malate glycosyltransferase